MKDDLDVHYSFFTKKGKSWHLDHFICSFCSLPLAGKDYNLEVSSLSSLRFRLDSITVSVLADIFIELTNIYQTERSK